MGNPITWIISGQDDFVFQHLLTPEGTVRRETISSATLLFTVTEATSSTISVTMTILDPVPLNGVRIECNGDMLQILTPSSSMFLFFFCCCQSKIQLLSDRDKMIISKQK